jgi:hypothetical protein
VASVLSITEPESVTSPDIAFGILTASYYQAAPGNDIERRANPCIPFFFE